MPLWTLTFTGGAGDDVTLYNDTAGQLAELTKGTAAAPDTTSDPLLKVQRIVQADSTQWSGDGSEPMASILGIGSGTVANDGQVVGVAGIAKTLSQTAVSSGGDDACGVYGYGRALADCTGVGIGGFFAGRRESDSGRITGIEVHSANYGASAAAYSSTTFSEAQAVWINCSGNADSASAITVSNAFGRQFEVGLAFTAQVTGGKTGGVRVNSIRDNSTSTTSILIAGTHSVAAVAVAASAGPVLLGGVTQLMTATLLEVQGTSAGDATNPAMLIGNTAGTGAHSLRFRNGSGSSAVSVCSAGGFLTSTASGDMAILSLTAGKAVHIGGTTKVISVTRENTLGFFAATPAAKPTGVAVTAEGIHAALVTLGLIAA